VEKDARPLFALALPLAITVTDREKASRAVIAAATSHADAIVSAVSAGISPYLKKSEPLPDIAALAGLLARRLKAEIDALVEADRAHEAELSDDAAHREARDDAAENVRTALVDLRDAVSTAYGAQGLLALGLAEAIPVDPSAIASRAKTVRKNLLDDSIKLPKPRNATSLARAASKARKSRPPSAIRALPTKIGPRSPSRPARDQKSRLSGSRSRY
jgi:hypothetical protein